MGRHPVFMLDWLIPISIATVLGFLAGMGVGGGSLLLLWLTQIVGMEQPQARILNLLFFLPAAMVATVFHKKETKPDRRVWIPGIIAGCGSALVFSLIGRSFDMELMKKLLGGLLILTGLREVFYRPRNAR